MKVEKKNNYIAPSIAGIYTIADARFMAVSGIVNGTGTSLSYDNNDQEWD